MQPSAKQPNPTPVPPAAHAGAANGLTLSVILIDNQVVHYEALGHGQPILFLHGWLGSWRYWLPTMERVAEHYRTYSFDFWGFGESQRKEVQESIATYAAQVIRFLDQLGIDRVTLVGHSMGGMVALATALSHPERISRLVTVGAPIDGNSLAWSLKLTDRPLFAHAFARMPWLRRRLFHFFLGVTQELPVGEMVADSVKSSADTLRLSVGSMWRTNLQPRLNDLHVPALIIHGAQDNVVNPNQLDLFDQIGVARVVLMPHSRHFPFLDQPELFDDILLRFLRT